MNIPLNWRHIITLTVTMKTIGSCLYIIKQVPSKFNLKQFKVFGVQSTSERVRTFKPYIQFDAMRCMSVEVAKNIFKFIYKLKSTRR